MSLIHDALKKVERERQLGAAPTLDAPRFERRRRRRWPWVLLVLVLLAGLAAAAAWHWRAPLYALARDVLVVLEDETRAPEPASDTEEALVLEPGADPAADAAPAAVVPPRGEPRPAAGSETPAPDARPAAPAADAAPSVRKGDAEPQPAAPPVPQSDSTQPVAKPAPAAPRREPGQAGPAAADPGLPMYWELPYGVRRDIPDMSITMHMYTEAPQERFVIINGERYREGDELEGEIKLVSVDADGVTLEKGGTRFRMPRTGMH